MKSWNALSESDLAELYLQSKGSSPVLSGTAAGLVADVREWLIRGGMNHRVDEAAAIASQAFGTIQQIREHSVPAQSQTEAAWSADLHEGIGDRRSVDDQALRYMDELALAGRVAAMDLEEYGRYRARLGVRKGTFEHLAGT